LREEDAGMAGCEVREARTLAPEVLRADRVSRTPGGAPERTIHEVPEKFWLAQAHEATERSLRVARGGVYQETGHGCVDVARHVDPLAQRGCAVTALED